MDEKAESQPVEHRVADFDPESKFVIGQALTHGNQGTIYLAINKESGSAFILKKYPQKYVRNALHEFNLVRAVSFQCRNIVQYHDLFSFKEDVYLLQEHLNGSTLREYMKKHKPVNPAVVYDYFTQLLQGVNFLHRHSIVHRDLKLENVMLHNGIVKIIDFGFAVMSTDRLYVAGTPQYMAREAFRISTIFPTMNVLKKCDIFACGVILFYLLFRKSWVEFNNIQTMDALKNFMENLDPIKIPPLVTDTNTDKLLFQILQSCLQKRYSDRPSAERILHQLLNEESC